MLLVVVVKHRGLIAVVHLAAPAIAIGKYSLEPSIRFSVERRGHGYALHKQAPLTCPSPMTTSNCRSEGTMTMSGPLGVDIDFGHATITLHIVASEGKTKKTLPGQCNVRSNNNHQILSGKSTVGDVEWYYHRRNPNPIDNLTDILGGIDPPTSIGLSSAEQHMFVLRLCNLKPILWSTITGKEFRGLSTSLHTTEFRDMHAETLQR